MTQYRRLWSPLSSQDDKLQGVCHHLTRLDVLCGVFHRCDEVSDVKVQRVQVQSVGHRRSTGETPVPLCSRSTGETPVPLCHRCIIRWTAALLVLMMITHSVPSTIGSTVQDHPTDTTQNPPPDESQTDPFARLERTVGLFDFDEPNNPHWIPKRWVRMEGTDYPRWNTSGFIPPTPDPNEPTDRVYELRTQGGSTGIRLVKGVITALPMTDYEATVDVQTIDMKHARARLAARFVDHKGTAIEASEMVSQPILSNGQWQTISVQLVGSYPDAAWIEVDLRIEQADLWMGRPRVGQEVRLQDVNGSTRFNNLIITRRPRISLSVSPITNTITAPDPVVVNIEVQDIGIGSLAGQMAIYDHHGNIVAERTKRVIQPNDITHWSPTLTGYGWYRAEMAVWDNGVPIGQADLDFAYLSPVQDSARLVTAEPVFRVLADDLEPEQWDRTLKYLEVLGTRGITLSLWPTTITEDGIHEYQQWLTPRLDELLQTSHEITLSIPAVPDTISELGTGLLSTVAPAIVFDYLTQENHPLWVYLDPLLIRFGQRIPHWQIGPVADNHALIRSSLPTGLDAVSRRFNTLVPSPTLVLPWSGDYSVPNDRDLRLTHRTTTEITTNYEVMLWLPNALPPHGAAEVVQRALESDVPVTVFFEPTDPELYGNQWTINDLTKRVVLAYESATALVTAEDGTVSRPSNPFRFAFRHPWTARGIHHKQFVPTFDLPVWKTLIAHLADRRAEDRLDLGSGITTIIFRDQSGDDETGGTIALWNESDRHESQTVHLFLGEGEVVATDPYGNRTPLPLIDGKHELVIGRQPMFIDGADINLALFRAGYRIEPNFIDTSDQVHEHDLILFNPWPGTLSGKLRITGPTNWKFANRTMNFSIPTGSRIAVPIKFTTPLYEVAGPKSVDVSITFHTRTSVEENQLDLSAPVGVGYKQITLHPSYRFTQDREGNHYLLITEEIRNNSEQSAWLEAFASAKGYSIQQATISNLGPGETTTRIFRFKLSGEVGDFPERVRVGLREMHGPGRLNQILMIQ